MTIKNIQDGKQWLGAKLGRTNVSDKTWRKLKDQGLPVGLLAGSQFISTEAVEAWLEAQAGSPMVPTPSSSTRAVPSPAPRRRGRPRKHVD